MSITIEERRRILADTAYHEATHAVCDHAAHLTIRYVSVCDYMAESVEEGKDRNDICVSSRPVEVHPIWGIEYAAHFIAPEWAVYKRRAWKIPRLSLRDFIEEAEEAEQAEESEFFVSDVVQAMEMLRLAEGFGMRGDLEACYEAAVEMAMHRLDCEWPFIVAVAERLIEVGYLSGDEVVEIIESVEQEANEEYVQVK